MLVSGFTYIRNAIKYDFPVVEAIRSILPIVDEFIVNVIESEDNTLELIQSIKDPKVKIITTPWFEELRGGGKPQVLFANRALMECKAPWCFYLQGDEVVHEKYLDYIKSALITYLDDQRVDGFALKYKHFYGNYSLYHEGEGWVRREIRIIRNLPEISAYKDSHSFRKNGEKLNVILLDAYIYHYGWARSKKVLKDKLVEQARWHWKDDNIVRTRFEEKSLEELMVHKNGLHFFKGTHPQVMLERINRQVANNDLTLEVKEEYLKRGLKWKLRDFVADVSEKLFRRRIGEYENFKLLGHYIPYKGEH
ncbi:MAG: glycosyltransferase family 2 protein [candidate division WOR-3 bacterium]